MLLSCAGAFPVGGVWGGRKECVAEVVRGGRGAGVAGGGGAAVCGRRVVEAGAGGGVFPKFWGGGVCVLRMILRGQVLGGDAGHVPGTVVCVVLRGGVALVVVVGVCLWRRGIILRL